MTTYFTHNTEADLALLPERYRGYSDLENIAAQVEADVISRYTDMNQPWGYTRRSYNPASTEINSDTGLAVFLSEYAADASAADTNFADAMRRTIAEVIAWRIRWVNSNPLLEGESTSESGKSRTYRQQAFSAFPPHWDWRLKPYDTRERGWGL